MALGRIVYVMGASGAGKTRLIDYARHRLDGSRPILFAHRYITRPPGKDGENYIALSRAEFALRQSRGLFACDWQAYGFDYGIGVEIRTWLAAGLSVVIDGSRAQFTAHRLDIAPLVPVLITAKRDVLRRRLTAREREDVASIETRLRRAEQFAPADLAIVTIDNSGAIGAAGEAFVTVLTDQLPSS